MDGKANQLGYYESSAGDLSYEKKYLAGIRGVEKDDVQAVLKRYLNKINMTIVAVAPESDKSALKEKTLNKAVTKAWDKELKQTKKDAGDGITKRKLDNGITVIVKEDRSNPTVAMYAAFPGGLRFETKDTNGIGNFTAAMLTYGTKKMKREELADEIEGMAGGISGFSGRNSSGVQANFLSRFFDKGLSIFADVIQNPVFPEDEIEKLRKDVLAAIKKEEDYLPGYTFKLLYRELYKKHPYGMTVSGTPEVVGALKKEDLARHYETIFVPSRMILTIVGDVSADYAIEKIKDAFTGFDRKAKPMPELAIEAPLRGVISTGEYKDKAQTNIGMGFTGPTALSKDIYATEVLTEILSGQGGRLFIELRDKKSLAYALSAFARPGVEPGTFGVYIG
ncbi:MAG: insulinase family protein, partial [Thermodesulfobacteriota bacterium]